MPDEEPALVLFVSEQGRFQVWLPVAGEIVQSTVTQTVFGKPAECSVTFSRLNSAGVVVQYCDLASEDVATQSSQQILEEARIMLTGYFDFSVDTQEPELMPGSSPALRLSGKADMRGLGYDGSFKARILLVGNRIYTVHMEVYQIDWCTCRHQMDQVIDSFHIDPP
jgi:hypothetical protein